MTMFTITVIFLCFPLALQCSTFNFTEVIENAELLNNQIEVLNTNLDKIIKDIKPRSRKKRQFVTTDVVSAAIATASLVQANMAYTLQMASHDYTIKQNIRNAKDTEKRRIQEDKHWRNVENQNGQMINKLDVITKAIKEASNTIVQTNFNEKVISKMSNLLKRYNLMRKTLYSSEHVEGFIQLCKDEERNPVNVIDTMVSLSDIMFNNALNETHYNQEDFFKVVMIYLRMANHFTVVYPYCSLFYHHSDNSTLNITLTDGFNSIDKVLKEHGVDRSKLFTNKGFMKVLFDSAGPKTGMITNFNDSFAYSEILWEKTKAFHNNLVLTFGGLNTYLSLNHTFTVIVHKPGHGYYHKPNVYNTTNIDYEHVETDEFAAFQMPFFDRSCKFDNSSYPYSCMCKMPFQDLMSKTCLVILKSDQPADVVHDYFQQRCGNNFKFLLTFRQRDASPMAFMHGHEQFAFEHITCFADLSYGAVYA